MKKVFVGLSGGVDSSVSAYLLKKEGYAVTGVFIRGWYPDFINCDWKKERRDSMRVAAQLNIPFVEINAEEEYRKMVIDQMVDQYKKGMTPNPDVWCNRYIKFDVFAKKAFEMGAEYIATGHYAFSHNGLFEAEDKDKDQTYFMWGIDKKVLNKLLTPIGRLKKDEVRKIAKTAKLFTHLKKDSQGLCFLGHIDLKDFLGHFFELKKGEVLNTKGERIGFHQGSEMYTIGQRHGFEIHNSVSDSKSYFVVAKDVKKNEIVVDTTPKMSIDGKIRLIDINILNKNKLSEGEEYTCRFRYRGELRKCRVEKITEDEIILGALDPVDSVTSGQSVVIYENSAFPKECLGGGVVYF